MPLIMGISDRVYCLEAGTVIAEGTPGEVRDDPRVIASYLGTDERAINRSGVTSADGRESAPVPVGLSADAETPTVAPAGFRGEGDPA